MNTASALSFSLNDHTEIPTTHKESWIKYPKYRWVYETTKLLDMQHIMWGPYQDTNTPLALDSFNYGFFLKPSTNMQTPLSGKIFVEKLSGNILTSFVGVFKGEIKWLSHKDQNNTILPNINGDIELRISALISLHFQKFSGLINIQTYGKDIIAVNLYANKEDYKLLNQEDPELFKHIVRIYNNRPWGK